MERTQVLDLMSSLRLYGMRSAYDEIMGNGIKRQHEPPRIVGDLLQPEIAEKQARSIRYQLLIAKLPLAKDIDDFDFSNTPVNEGLIRDLATGTFAADQRKRGAGWRYGDRQVAPGYRHCPCAYTQWHTRAFLQCRRSGQPSRNRNTQRQTGPDGRLPQSPRLHHSR